MLSSHPPPPAGTMPDGTSAQLASYLSQMDQLQAAQCRETVRASVPGLDNPSRVTWCGKGYRFLPILWLRNLVLTQVRVTHSTALSSGLKLNQVAQEGLTHGREAFGPPR